MTARSPELQHCLQSMHAAIVARCTPHSPAGLTAQRIFGALQATPGKRQCPPPSTLPPCALLDTLVTDLSDAGQTTESASANGSEAYIDHAHSLLHITRQLAWAKRPGAERTGEPFASGHANATLIGKGGLEERSDVWIGVTLMAPNVPYPEHRHAPEEVYVVLSPGEWQQSRGDWHEPGVGGIVHNPPNVLHAMRSGATPLLSTWCLWIG
jgi:quercetin dioxygenase-like cupin family protein